MDHIERSFTMDNHSDRIFHPLVALRKPAAGEKLVVSIKGGEAILFPFDWSDTTISTDSDGMTLCLDGGTIVLQGVVSALSASGAFRVITSGGIFDMDFDYFNRIAHD